MSKPNAIGAEHERAVADVADLLGMTPIAVQEALRPMKNDGEIVDRLTDRHGEPVPDPVVKRRVRRKPPPAPPERPAPRPETELVQLLANFRAAGFSRIGNAPPADQARARMMNCSCGRRGLWTKAARVPGSESWRTAAYCPNCRKAVEI